MQVRRVSVLLFLLFSIVISRASNGDGDPDGDEQFEVEADQAVQPAESGPQAPVSTETAVSQEVTVPMVDRDAAEEDSSSPEEQTAEDQGAQEPQSVGPQASQAHSQSDKTNQVSAPQALYVQPAHEAQATVDAQNAHTAAQTAMHAAKVANRVAAHSVHITKHAKSALKDAREALHAARVDSKGLSGEQKESLKKAEAKLKEATKKAAYGDVKNAKYVKGEADNKRLQKLENKMDTVKAKKGNMGDELDALLHELDVLRQQLAQKGGDKDIDAALVELEDDLQDMKKASKSGKVNQASLDEMKAEIEKLRAQIAGLDPDADVQPASPPSGVSPAAKPKVALKPLEQPDVDSQEATPIEAKGIDIDTAMPYGDLEPFGREDTAQELTEDSIRESDGMVDQLERAEVAEEKRAVFRALTRLRGAAITSFDGIARSQTGNIDEYNKIHQWRGTHPLHHLADEESDVSKWAFPDNAD
jgi:hypothetical protein|mmetsp:Transcript_93795/g.146476  ORF Transcript_93795/g.146476 Transcript_93795/m.146476 type:complete len:474 (-) Transcript_93795:66-1487(-)